MTRTTTRRTRFDRVPVVPAAPTIQDLRRLVLDTVSSIALLPADSVEARRRAQHVVDALIPIVRLPVGGDATVEDGHTVTLRELAILQRWLGRAADVPQHEVTRAYTRLQDTLAAA